MSKIKLNAILNSNFENLDIKTVGIKSNNKIVYKENDITVTILIYKNKIEINRLNNEYSLNLVFEENKNTKSIYKLFNISKNFILDTKCTKLVIDEKIINIEYIIEDNKFMYILKIGE